MHKLIVALILSVILSGCQTGFGLCKETPNKSDPIKYLEYRKIWFEESGNHPYIERYLEEGNATLRKKYKTIANIRAALAKQADSDEKAIQQDPRNHKPLHASLVEGPLSELLTWLYCGYRDTEMQGIAVYNLYGGLEGYAWDKDGKVTHSLYLSGKTFEDLPKDRNHRIFFSLTKETEGMYALICPVLSNKSGVITKVGYTIFYFQF